MKTKIIISALVLLLISNFVSAQTIKGKVTDAIYGYNLQNVRITNKSTTQTTLSGYNGTYTIEANKGDILMFKLNNYRDVTITVNNNHTINVKLSKIGVEASQLDKNSTMVEMADCEMEQPLMARSINKRYSAHKKIKGYPSNPPYNYVPSNTESYAMIKENGFKNSISSPLSTFSIDVDAASYSNVRRFVNNGNRPPADAVRIEEMINYFNYDYKTPTKGSPFSVNTEIAQCPWNKQHKILHIGLQGEQIDMKDLPNSNLVFLIDVSGSMSASNKLPLLKSSLKMLVNQLEEKDKVSIVVYAGAAGLVLKSTSCDEKETIISALESLNAGGSTAGGEGLRLAYKIAKENFIEDGNNRIIIATDGDFNVGVSSNSEMEKLIIKERDRGVFISVLGFGMGNYQDDKMEIIADKGNGNYSYIDNMQEAHKVLVKEAGGTLHTIAKDVKIQVEFNPKLVQAYRLIGYENRALENEDFNNDKKDAGELGAGHTVTALYEIVPVGVEFRNNVDELKYQSNRNKRDEINTDELATVKLRYKKPKETTSILVTHSINDKNMKFEKSSNNMQFSTAVALFGMILRDSEYISNITLKDITSIANRAKGKDLEGYRGEFVRLVNTASVL